MTYTRREIGKLALAALPAARAWAAKPNSVFGGVQVGINAPYSFWPTMDQTCRGAKATRRFAKSSK